MFDTMANTATATQSANLTAGKLREACARLQALASPPPIRIIESEFATREGGRVKTYPKRKAKSESHWRRMDKKWRKRYGFARVPCMYRMKTPLWAFGADAGEYLVVHPSLVAQLRASLRRIEGRT
jgi:hypothetical protein